MDVPDKATLRAQVRKTLAALSNEIRSAASAEISRRIVATPEWTSARTVGLYAAQSTEPDLSRLLNTAGKTFCFPRVSGEALAFHQCHSLDLLQPGPWHLLEPNPAQCPVIPAPEIDLLLIPGMAFTRTGGRLGRGGGFYDRFLIGVHPRAVKVGVCFAVQMMVELPQEAHDHEVDWVVTETDLVRAS